VSRPPLVLVYHGFGQRTREEDPHNLFVAEEDFERQLRLLRRMFRPLDLREYMLGWKRQKWPPRSVLITIDDGYESILSCAAPILARYRFPASVFVPASKLAGTSSWMPKMPNERLVTPADLRELRRLGIEIGVHGMNHVPLPGLSPATLHTEVSGARTALASILGETPASFAYPEGKFDEASVRAVEEAGYSVAFSVHLGGTRFTIRRVPIDRLDSIIAFSVKLVPGYQALYRATTGNRRLRRGAAWLSGQRK
jgi:peptidoglycan/xylan/chitin deacetylase (PgdA/CDA1 family)